MCSSELTLLTDGNMKTTLALCIFSLFISFASCQSAEDFTRLHQNLYKIHPSVRPAKNSSCQTKISMSFHLVSINSFETVNQKLVSTGWLHVMWKDDYVMWNPSDYGGVTSMHVDADKVWKPTLINSNTKKEVRRVGLEYNPLVAFFDGTMHWYPAESFETFCQVDVSNFPFDFQQCRWEFGTLSYDISVFDLYYYEAPMDTSSFGGNGEWELLSGTGYRELRYYGPKTSPFMVFEATLRRRLSLIVMTVMIPVMVLSIVNVFVFVIPSETGERLSYAITVLLSFGVFMSFIMDSMPSSAETVSIVAINLSCLLVLSAVYVLLCILTLQLFHRDDHKHPVPGYVQTLVVWLEMVVCLDPPAKNKVNVIQVATVDGQKDGGDGSVAAKLALKKQLYANPDEMTWKRVSRSLDKLFFRFFFLLVLVSNIAVWVIIAKNYY